MRYKPTGDADEAAEALAQRLGGLPGQTITGFGNREFDAISDDYVAQTTASRSAVTKPNNFSQQLFDERPQSADSSDLTSGTTREQDRLLRIHRRQAAR